MKEKLFNFIISLRFVIFIGILLSICCSTYFVLYGNLNLAYFDANTRLNIARRMFDSLTPGFAQIGNVWPPFPQILFYPLVHNDSLWRTGIAGSIVSGLSYIVTIFFIYKSVLNLTKKKYLSFIAALSFLLNINVIYLQSTAMSEPFFWTTLTGIFYFLTRYIKSRKINELMFIAFFTILCSLTRYEGYAVLIAITIIVIFLNIIWKFKKNKVEGNLILYIVPASLGLLFWSFYLWIIFGDPLYWLHHL